MVTGPSLVSETSIIAPNSPRPTGLSISVDKESQKFS